MEEKEAAVPTGGHLQTADDDEDDDDEAAGSRAFGDRGRWWQTHLTGSQLKCLISSQLARNMTSITLTKET